MDCGFTTLNTGYRLDHTDTEYTVGGQASLPFAMIELGSDFSTKTRASQYPGLMSDIDPGAQWTYRLVVTQVPEPATYLIFLAGLAAVGVLVRKKPKALQ